MPRKCHIKLSALSDADKQAVAMVAKDVVIMMM